MRKSIGCRLTPVPDCDTIVTKKKNGEMTMVQPNTNYQALSESYLFAGIARRVSEFREAHPDTPLLRMGIGDVTRPLCPAVIRALHEAVDDQADAARFHGYMPECGAPFLRRAVAEH